MYSHDDCIAVFDSGKTNKKLLIYNMELKIVDSVYTQLEAEQQGTEAHERLAETGEWLLSNLSSMSKRHAIKAVSISSHGATFVCLDGEGHVVLPVFSYTTDPGKEFHDKFAAEFGDPRTLQRATNTPDMPGLGCMAKGLFYAKENYPGELARTRHILNLPQYYGYLLTGVAGMEYTYIANHTHLWDLDSRTWSNVMRKLGLSGKFPHTLNNPWEVLGTVSREVSARTGLSDDVVVTYGIHDSNAALLPYLITEQKPFMLLSTGTTCVTMHPTATATLLDDELGRVIFYNLSAFGTPVKTSIFLAGLEFDVYMEMLKQRHNRLDHPAYSEQVLEDILVNRNEFILPSIVPFGMFPDSAAKALEKETVYTFDDMIAGRTPEFFNNYERSYAILVLSIALQARVALEHTGLSNGMKVFVEGGFCRNDFYTRLISSLSPAVQFEKSDLHEATGFGTALLALSALEGCHPKMLSHRFKIETSRLEPSNFGGLQEYADCFIHQLGGYHG